MKPAKLRRHALIYGGALALYVALMAVTWAIGTRQARQKTEALLDYSILDIGDTVAGAIDTMLDHVAVTVARAFGKAEAYPMPVVARVAELFDIDEISIIDATNVVVASNDPHSLGVDMTLNDATRPFAALADGTAKTVSQPFRRHAYSQSRRKYLGIPFPGGGYVQIGLDEARMEKMLPTLLGYIFDQWLVGEKGFYLCAETGTGRLISNPSRHFNKAATLEETGFDVAKVPPDMGAATVEEIRKSTKTFRMRLFGETTFCRTYVFAGYRIVSAVPYSEFYDSRDVIATVMAALLAMVLGGFAFFLSRIYDDSDRFKAFYAAEDERRAKDMEIAKTIQTSALPAPLAASPYFRLAASMTPAREVGGDFYDFFTLDATHLAFLVADVSGKGITAALYMMTAKTVIKDAVLSMRDIAAAFTEANVELCRNNTANMFLTAWGGILDLETGDVAFVNAGHNPPVKVGKRGTGSGERVEWLAAKSGPMMAFMDGVKYKARSVRLSPGDSLFLYTDGVTEAMDAKGELFGEKRLLEALAVAPQKPDDMCGTVRAVVGAFAAGAPASDDLTVLAVEYVSRPSRFVRSFPPAQEGVAQASAFLDECLEKSGSDATVASTLHVVLDEIASNIVNHSGASGFEVDVEFMEEPAGVKLVFIDDGAPYDPLAHADPDTSIAAADRPIGGLGILMVKKMSDSVSYERTRNRNFLSVFKRT